MTTLPNVSSKYGAPMGRRDQLPEDRNTAVVLEIQRLMWVDGDYDEQGAYWGHVEGDYIWRFTGEDTDFFARAKTEAEAVAALRETLPHAIVHCDGLEDFVAAYIKAALFTSTAEDGEHEHLDEYKDESDLAPETLAAMRENCTDFLVANREMIEAGLGFSQAGHDFWLTRNHHGCGFWDGDWPDVEGRLLTDAADAFGECDLYVGDDGKIYQS